MLFGKGFGFGIVKNLYTHCKETLHFHQNVKLYFFGS
jgi:hypothetical protein